MHEQKLEISAAAGTAQAVVFAPEQGKLPGILFYTDIFGIRPGSLQVARQLAECGFTVMMPNAFYRFGRLPLLDFEFRMGEERSMKALGALMAALPGTAMEADAPFYVDALLARADVRGPAIGAVGYCFTGAMALRTAAVAPGKVAAVASFHGGQLVTDAPDSPHTRIPRVKAELYFAHAVEDASMPPAAIEKLDDALKGWGGRFESEVYEGARHGWTMPDREIYDEKQAARAFAKMADLFKRNL